MTPSTKKTPAWLVEQAAQGELTDAEVAELRARLAAEGRSLDEELDKLRQSDRQVLTQLPRATMGAAIRRRADAQHEPRSRLSMLLPPLALAGTLGLVILVARSVGDGGTVVTQPAADDEQIGIKGDEARSPRLLVYRQRPGQASASDSELLPDGARCARGDLLQLAYDRAPDGLYGVLVSLDGAGKVTQHLPEEGAKQAAPLVPVRELRLPSAYELDDAPAFERFVLVTAAQPFAISVALDAATALAQRGLAARSQPLPLAASFRQTSVSLHKMREGTP
jgi:hypothetical protein